ncbi:MAG: hypothetical protein V2A54_13060 [Bacteroidota bacterium]
MKLTAFFLQALICFLLLFTTELKSQIPNFGFEEWNADKQNPVGWNIFECKNNGSGTQINNVIKSSNDHYPLIAGQLSLRMESIVNENNISSAKIYSGKPEEKMHPAFPISGNPMVLTGQFKYFPQNGDSMFVKLVLFKNGKYVAHTFFIESETVSEWSTFFAGITPYEDADSGCILIAPYYATKHYSKPKGNSILYIDNLSFDIPISDAAPKDDNGIQNIEIFQTEDKNQVHIKINDTRELPATAYLADYTGKIIKEVSLKSNLELINLNDLAIGCYILTIKNYSGSITRKLLH